MALKGLSHRNEVVDLDDDDIVRKVMVVEDEGACIGCGACSKVCPVDCQIHGRGEALDATRGEELGLL
jgi:ferredoxin